MRSIKLLDINQIISLETYVSEQINRSNLFDYLKTNILQNDIKFDKDTVIFYSYIERLKKYNVYIAQNQKKQNISLIPHIFSVNYISNASKSIDLYITDKFFALYCGGDLQCFKAFESKKASHNDIEKYLSAHIDIKVDNIYTIDNNQLNEITKDYLKNYNNVKPLQKPVKNSSISKWLLVFMICFLLISYIYYSLEESNVDKEKDIIVPNKIVAPMISAVVGNSILIDGVWYDEKQKYKDFTIDTITLNKIILINNNKRYIIGIKDE